MKKIHLNKEEREILNSVERGEWKASKPTRQELGRWAQIARNTLRKDQRMNIRISKADLTGLKIKAAEEGVPYQTLVTSILHKYLSRDLAAA